MRRPAIDLVPVAVLALAQLLCPGCGPVDDGATPDADVDAGAGSAQDAGGGDAAVGSPRPAGRRGFVCEEVEAVSSCGEAVCAELGSSASDFCATTCCTGEGRCGARVAVVGRGPGPCIEQAQPDARCPSHEGAFGVVDGCCTGDFECGVLFGPMCTPLRDLWVDPSSGVPQPVDCAGNPLPGFDGGELDGGAAAE